MEPLSRSFSCSSLLQFSYLCGKIENFQNLNSESKSPDKIDLIFSQITFENLEDIRMNCSKDHLARFLSLKIQNQDILEILLSLNRTVSQNLSLRPSISNDLHTYAIVLDLFVTWKGTDMSLDNNYREIKFNFVNHFDELTEWTEGRVLCHYILTSFKFLTLFWGQCYRNLDVDDSEINEFQEGSLICVRELWIASKERKRSGQFKCELIIDSLNGRNVRDLLGHSFEDFVVFPPFCQFFIIKMENIGNYLRVYLKEMPLGIEDKTVLWVDDNAFNPSHENKKIIEKILEYDPATQIVLRNTTDSAVEYLKSYIGTAKISTGSRGFRIITNMSRANEKDPYRAGARLIKAALELGCKGNMMIFTSSVLISQNSLRNLNIAEPEVLITTDSDVVLRFIKFEY